MGRRGRRLLKEETTFFITTTAVRFARVFAKDKYCDILIHNIKHYQDQHKFIILGYVIMPSHLQWIIEVKADLGTISDIMRDIKKYSAWDIMEALEKDRQVDLIRLFEQESKGYLNQKRKFWMNRFDDEVIRNPEMLRTKLEYVHYNPVKEGLVKEAELYKYSSARNYILGDQPILGL